MQELQDVARYIRILAESLDRTTRAEDRSAYTRHLAAAAMLVALVEAGDSSGVEGWIDDERRTFGWAYLVGPEGDAAEQAFNDLADEIGGAPALTESTRGVAGSPPRPLSPGEHHRWWKDRGGRELRQLLYWRWDPIGVSDAFPVTLDEYDSYTGALARLLHVGGDTAAVSAYLETIERERMGAPGRQRSALDGGTAHRRLVRRLHRVVAQEQRLLRPALGAPIRSLGISTAATTLLTLVSRRVPVHRKSLARNRQLNRIIPRRASFRVIAARPRLPREGSPYRGAP